MRDRSALKVYFPEEVFFCLQPTLRLTPDSIVGGIEPYSYRWWSDNGVLSLSDTLEWEGNDTTRLWLEVTDSEGFRGRSSTLAIPYPLIPACMRTCHSGEMSRAVRNTSFRFAGRSKS